MPVDLASDSLRAVFTGRWTIEPPLVLALELAAIVYACGWIHLRGRRPERAAAGRLVAFLAGLGTIFVALASPLDTIADRRLAIHMTQHLLLLVVAPALIALGAPTVPLLLGLPAGRVRAVVGALLTRLVERFHRPLLGLTTMSLAMWGWHWPPAFELAVRSPAWHVVEHASFIAAGLLFWWPVVEPWPSRPRWPRWAMIPYLLFADVQNTALAALLVFSDRVLYPSYARAASALNDQAAAGVLMWVPMSLAYLIPAAVLTARSLAPRALKDLQVLRATQPSIRIPLAAIQLPATRTAILAQSARKRTTNAPTSATKTNTAEASPRRAAAADPDAPIPAPFKYP
jgi:cytochrome c oxidase assembly factor CtaG